MAASLPELRVCAKVAAACTSAPGTTRVIARPEQPYRTGTAASSICDAVPSLRPVQTAAGSSTTSAGRAPASATGPACQDAILARTAVCVWDTVCWEENSSPASAQWDLVVKTAASLSLPTLVTCDRVRTGPHAYRCLTDASANALQDLVARTVM